MTVAEIEDMGLEKFLNQQEALGESLCSSPINTSKKTIDTMFNDFNDYKITDKDIKAVKETASKFI